MKTTRLILPILGTAFSVFAGSFDGSRTTPVHRIPLADEAGEKIIPTVPGSMPFSAKMTCGACHDYEAIHGGSHFKGAGRGRSTEPWIVVDEKTGVQVPADRMGLSDWEFTKRFGSHLPGGAVSDPDNKLVPDARWDISGGLEINCLACHNQSHRQDLTEWTKQVARENFRWAATAASGIGEVGGMASRMPDWWNVYAGELPDDKVYRVPPSVNYDESLFDSKHRAWFDIGKPQARSCLQCHSTHPVTAQRMDVPGDVHAAAGLSCTDCHRSGEDHQMLRGTTETMSCAACHMEDGAAAGQSGAPIAHHKGLPPVHFEELTCTACHSGLMPDEEPQLIRTSRANRLGIYGRAQWYTESPFIVEPVYVRNEDGKIEPRRMMWPAFWADAEGNPLPEETVAEAAVGILDTAEQVGGILASFANAEYAKGEPLYIAGGNAYALNVDGGLDLVGRSDTAVSFMWQTPSNTVSTIPEFDVKAEEVDYDAEGEILGVMEALKPLEVVMVSKGRVFDLGEDGYLFGKESGLADGWYTKNGQPLVSAFVERAVVDVVGTKKSFNEAQAAAMLNKLGNGTSYVSNGRRFELSGGSLVAFDDEKAAPVSWPVGHDVRGAAQSLGAKACADCHAEDSAFLFGNVTATGPLLTDKALVKSMHEFQELDGGFNKMFSTTFKMRSVFKGSLGILAGLLGLIVLAVGLPLVYCFAAHLSDREVNAKPVKAALMGAMLVQLITGFLFGWPLSCPLDGFPLLVHAGFGALYAALLVVWSLMRSRTAGVWGWILILSGIVLILSVLLAMFPLFGTHGQHTAAAVHRAAAVVSVAAALMLCLSAKKAK